MFNEVYSSYGWSYNDTELILGPIWAHLTAMKSAYSHILWDPLSWQDQYPLPTEPPLRSYITARFRHSSPNDIKTVTHQESIEIDGQKYDIKIKRIGKDVKLAKTVQAWLANPEQSHPDRPPRYIDSKNFGTRAGVIAHLSMYKEYIETRALFRHELRKIDPELARAIDLLISKKLVPLELIPAKMSEKKEIEFLAIQKLDAPFTKKLILHNGKLHKNSKFMA